MYYENEKTELKKEYVEDIYKEVIAFANTDDGTILVGVNDEGEKVGIKDIDDTYTRITNGIRDTILPDVTIFVKYTMEEKEIIKIEVAEGSYKPYYLRSKGLKPSGVYVRQGTSSVPASSEQIRRMIKDADGNVFENFRSLNQELSFEETTEIFKKRNLVFSEDKYYTLGVKNKELGLYTNLGWLLSDQCAHTIKVAVFSDMENTVFRDKKEFGGSVFKQIEKTYAYLQLCNQNRAVIEGLERKENWDYPKEAVREALLNAVVHRDYGLSGSILINVNEKEMEFISLGGLVGGLSPEDIRNGVSLSRNSKLAEVFYRLQFIEAYGTGIRRIYSLYRGCKVQPEISVTQNSFRITLPNRNAPACDYLANDMLIEREYQQGVTSQMKRLLDYMEKYGEITGEDIQEFLDIKRTRAYLLTREMTEKGLIKTVGRGKEKRFIPAAARRDNEMPEGGIR